MVGFRRRYSVRNIAHGYCGWGVRQPVVSVYRSESFRRNPFEDEKKTCLRYYKQFVWLLNSVWFVNAETKKNGKKRSGVGGVGLPWGMKQKISFFY